MLGVTYEKVAESPPKQWEVKSYCWEYTLTEKKLVKHHVWKSFSQSYKKKKSLSSPTSVGDLIAVQTHLSETEYTPQSFTKDDIGHMVFWQY